MKIYRDVAGVCTQFEVPILGGGGNLFDKKVRSFLDAVKTNGASPVPSSQIIKNQAILDGIVRSAELGREVEINLPDID